LVQLKVPRFVVLPPVNRATATLSRSAERYPLPSNPCSVGSSSSQVAPVAKVGLTGKHPNAQSRHRFCIVPVAIAAGIGATFGSAVGGSFAQLAQA
jgi:hypothetical protein